MPLSAGQIQMPSGLVLGVAPYKIESVEGLSVIETRDADIAKVADHGYQPGLDLGDRRRILIKASIQNASSLSSTESYKNSVRSGFKPLATPTGMNFLLPNATVEKLVYMTPRRTAWIDDDLSLAAGYTPFVAEVICADPLIYSATLHSTSVVGGSGTTINNAGTWPVKPVLKATGAATNPRWTLTGGGYIQANITMTGGQSLVIDVPAHSVTLNGTQRRDLIDSSVVTWWELASGNNTVTYSGGGTTATVEWRDAWV